MSHCVAWLPVLSLIVSPYRSLSPSISLSPTPLALRKRERWRDDAPNVYSKASIFDMKLTRWGSLLCARKSCLFWPRCFLLLLTLQQKDIHANYLFLFMLQTFPFSWNFLLCAWRHQHRETHVKLMLTEGAWNRVLGTQRIRLHLLSIIEQIVEDVSRVDLDVPVLEKKETEYDSRQEILTLTIDTNVLLWNRVLQVHQVWRETRGQQVSLVWKELRETKVLEETSDLQDYQVQKEVRVQWDIQVIRVSMDCLEFLDYMDQKEIEDRMDAKDSM